MADQLRYDALGCYGNSQIHTPNIDSIALTGATFDSHYVQNPVCSPSRCTLITGRYPKNHGTRDNGVPLRDQEVTIAQMLQDQGYRTAAIGKMHLTTQIVPKEREEEDWPANLYGFDITQTSCDTKTGEYLDWLKEVSPENYAIVKRQGEKKMQEDCASAADKDLSGPPQVYPSDVDPKYHQTNWIAKKTIELIEAEDEKPFFAMCSFVDPHHPFDPPVPYATMYDPDTLASPNYVEGELDDKPPHFLRHRTGNGFSNEKYDYRLLSDRVWKEVKAAYYGMVTLIDDAVGDILKALKDAGKDQDTIVLFTTDHGELLGDHGLLFKGPFMYDCLIKAPMVMKWPNVIPQGSRFQAITEHVDVVPTLLDLVGARPALGVQGQSMAPILRGDLGAGKSCAMTEFKCYDWGLDVKTIVTRDYKLTYYAGQCYGELYDRLADPNERTNLWDAEDYAVIRQDMIRKLLDRVIQTEDTLPLRIARF